MKNTFAGVSIVVLIAAAIVCGGCAQAKSRVFVTPDGSGMVELSGSLNREFIPLATNEDALRDMLDTAGVDLGKQADLLDEVLKYANIEKDELDALKKKTFIDLYENGFYPEKYNVDLKKKSFDIRCYFDAVPEVGAAPSPVEEEDDADFLLKRLSFNADEDGSYRLALKLDFTDILPEGALPDLESNDPAVNAAAGDYRLALMVVGNFEFTLTICGPSAIRCATGFDVAADGRTATFVFDLNKALAYKDYNKTLRGLLELKEFDVVFEPVKAAEEKTVRDFEKKRDKIKAACKKAYEKLEKGEEEEEGAF